MPFVIEEGILPPDLASGVPAPLSLQLIQDLAPFERDSYDIQAVLRAIEGELTRLEVARQQMILSWFPATADALLGMWEAIVGLPVDNPQFSLAQRQAAVLAFMQRLKGEFTGLSWEQTITGLIGANWTYQEHDPADGSSPAAYCVLVNAPFNPPAAPPIDLSLSPASGGHLAAGTYWYAVSSRTLYGESLCCTPVSSGPVATNSEVTVTWARTAYATGYRVYRGVSPTLLYFLEEVADPQDSILDDGTGVLSMQPMPTQDTSEAAAAQLLYAMLRDITPAHIAVDHAPPAPFPWLTGISQIGIDLL
jgi:uncharacterized protein DUF2313